MNKFGNALGLQCYEEYLTSFSKWVENKTSSNSHPSPALVEFTRLNWARTQRLIKTLVLDQELISATHSLNHEYSFVVITEAWCGDSAQILPYIAAWVKLFGERAKLFIALRDEQHQLMDLHLTEGARAIPKLIIIDEVLQKEVSVWGPRPIPAQQLVMEWKKNPKGRTWDELELELHTWYAKDKGKALQEEWINIVKLLKENENSIIKKSA